MTQALHSEARTTHLIREEIQTSTLSQAALARLYNVARQTIRKWQDRKPLMGKSHCPVKLHTTLTEVAVNKDVASSHAACFSNSG